MKTARVWVGSGFSRKIIEKNYLAQLDQDVSELTREIVQRIASQLLGADGPDRLVVTDSILPTRLADTAGGGRLVLLEASRLFGEAIRPIARGESVVALREMQPRRR